LLLPGAFIAIAEECGLIARIGQWVLREACGQAHAWIDAGLKFDQIAVNMSAVEFRNPHCLESVCATLRDAHLDAHHLELELTETVLLRNADATSSVLHALSFLGVRIAVDDFGTGYSSLSHLRQFPIDTLKVDRSFVQNIDTDIHDAAIVGAIIAMGQRLGLRVVAEGVETRELVALLQAQGCLEGQGFHFGHPLPAEAFRRLLEDAAQSTASNDVRASERVRTTC
jgi:EAL domain-containing protein (putative c-di-GMP-specific phosphodiesterase class I)